jgi:hypothetical protein
MKAFANPRLLEEPELPRAALRPCNGWLRKEVLRGFVVGTSEAPHVLKVLAYLRIRDTVRGKTMRRQQVTKVINMIGEEGIARGQAEKTG